MGILDHFDNRGDVLNGMVWDHIIIRTQWHELITRVDNCNLAVVRSVAVVALALTNRKGVAIRKDVLGQTPFEYRLHSVGGWLVLHVRHYIIPISRNPPQITTTIITQPPIWSMLVRLSVSSLYWSLMALLPVHAFIRGIVDV